MKKINSSINPTFLPHTRSLDKNQLHTFLKSNPAWGMSKAWRSILLTNLQTMMMSSRFIPRSFVYLPLHNAPLRLSFWSPPPCAEAETREPARVVKYLCTPSRAYLRKQMFTSRWPGVWVLEAPGNNNATINATLQTRTQPSDFPSSGRPSHRSRVN